MELNSLTAISPIDGRYRKASEKLSKYFSEYGLMKYRVRVEIEYFIKLCEIKLKGLENFDHSNFPLLREIYEHFSDFEALKIKNTEKITNHDLKAVEYFIKEKLQDNNLGEFAEYIHFGLTSQDINNTAIPLSIKEAYFEVISPELESLIKQLEFFANQWKNIPMLAHTHGQPASPTILGKELMVFVERIKNQKDILDKTTFGAKFGGATGGFNAHYVAFPEIDWVDFANQFVNQTLGLSRQQFTTQIEHYDNMGAFFDGLKRINTILIDLDRDFWQYISMDYFKQKVNPNEIGSSAMPHKVNPIDFENSEGNLGFANAIFEHLSSKLPISRLQRDLSDSTVLRNIGVPVAHSLIGYVALSRGLAKLELNEKAINEDLENNWAVVAEGIQTILRREKFEKPYEALKELTRTGEKINKESITSFIKGLNVRDEVKEELLKLSPMSYTGIKLF
ncbi:MAG: adenylosuccinate lyase [Cytophagales bacterium]